MFKNLRAILEVKLQEEISKAVESPEKWLTEKECANIQSGKKSVKDYYKKIVNKVSRGYTGGQLCRLDAVESATKGIKSITITVEWKKSKMWGHNPTATAEFIFTDNTFARYKSESIGGCGYDKESTATGQALNQCNELLNMLYAKKDANPEQNQRETLGYGSGYGVLPYFEGGVGFTCHAHILEKLGFNYLHTASGETFNAYRFEK